MFSVVLRVVFVVERTELERRATRRNAGHHHQELLFNAVPHVCDNRNPCIRNYHIQQDSFVQNHGTS